MNVLFSILISAAIGWFGSQLFKALLNTFTATEKTFKYFMKCFFSDGDFPSSHTCYSTTHAMVMIFYLMHVIDNPTDPNSIVTMASCFISFVIVELLKTAKDSVGIRGNMKKTNQNMKKICKHMEENINAYGQDSNSQILTQFWTKLSKNININVGHMPHEVIGGLILGSILGITIISYISCNNRWLILSLVALVVYLVVTTIVITSTNKKK